MKEERISNYVKLCEEWAQRFLKMDQADLHKRVPELKEENGFLTIIHFGRRYGVSLEDGSIRSLDGQREPDTTETVSYTHLCSCDCCGGNVWIWNEDLPEIEEFMVFSYLCAVILYQNMLKYPLLISHSTHPEDAGKAT